MAKLLLWLTPVWLLSVGVALGLVLLLVIYGVLGLVSRRSAREVPSIIKEGILLPITYLALFLTGFALLAAIEMPRRSLMNSVRRMTSVGPDERSPVVPARTRDHVVDLSFRSEELAELEFESDRDLQFYTDAPDVPDRELILTLEGSDPIHWTSGAFRDHPFTGHVERFYVTNQGDIDAHLNLRIVTAVEMPEAYIIPKTAAAMVGLFAVYFLIRLIAPKLSAIAVATAKEASSQPIYFVALALGAFALIIFIYVPYNTFGEDVKMLKDSGLTLILVLAILVALWTASVSVAEEIEGRTALTLLSKPIGRRQFMIGKFLGIVWPIVLMFVVLGILFLITVSYKVVYDSREGAASEPTWQHCYRAMIQIVPGLVLAFMETVVLASISVAISTRLSMLPNLVICSSIYVLGHLGPLIVNSSAGQFEIVGFVGQLIAIVLPVLDHFNIQAAVAAGKEVPMVYLGWALVYCILYSSIAMILALAMFEDRDLA